ncbi:hypothetical protein Tco_1205804 [Tanacetum coccineum]
MRTLASVKIEIILILGLPCYLSSSSVRCLENVVDSRRMSTPVFVDPEISTQADRAQSSRVPVPLSKDPFEAIRQAYLVGTDTESEPIEAPESPHTVASPTSLPDSTPPTCHDRAYSCACPTDDVTEPLCLYGRVEDDEEEDEEMEESLDFDSVSGGVEDEGPTTEDEDPARGIRVLLSRTRAQSSGFIPESERPEIVSALRQPTHTTWMNPEDGIVYIDVPTYPPPTPPAQTPPSLEWSSGSLPISPEPSIVPSSISSPMIPLTVPSPVASLATAETEGFLTELGARVEMQGGLIRDHSIRLEELSPALFERYDRDIG